MTNRSLEDKPTKTAFVPEVHYFRAVAISFIVLGHSLFLPRSQEHYLLFVFLSNALQNGTVLFVFIAGFLFSYLSDRFVYTSYLYKKFWYVVIPYVILSTPVIIERIVKGYAPGHVPDWFNDQPPLLSALAYIITGRHLEGYWFIPMISVFYLLSPVFLKLKEKNFTLYLGFFLFAVSIFLNRSLGNFNPIHSFIYFLPVYIFGVVAGSRLDAFRRLSEAMFYPSLLAVVALILFRTFYLNDYGLYFSSLSEFPSEPDLLLIQKMLLCVVLFHFMRRVERGASKPLAYLADVSFAIYFLHPFALRLADYILDEIPASFSDGVTFLLTATLCFGATLAAVASARMVLGRQSRVFIGA